MTNTFTITRDAGDYIITRNPPDGRKEYLFDDLVAYLDAHNRPDCFQIEVTTTPLDGWRRLTRIFHGDCDYVRYEDPVSWEQIEMCWDGATWFFKDYYPPREFYWRIMS